MGRRMIEKVKKHSDYRKQFTSENVALNMWNHSSTEQNNDVFINIKKYLQNDIQIVRKISFYATIILNHMLR